MAKQKIQDSKCLSIPTLPAQEETLTSMKGRVSHVRKCIEQQEVESEKKRTNSLNRPVKKKAFSFSYTKPEMLGNNVEQRPTSAAGHHHKKPDTSGTGTNIYFLVSIFLVNNALAFLWLKLSKELNHWFRHYSFLFV